MRAALFLFVMLSYFLLADWGRALISRTLLKPHFDGRYIFAWTSAYWLTDFFGLRVWSEFEIEFSHGRLGFRKLGESQPIYFKPGEIEITEQRQNLLYPARLRISTRGLSSQMWRIPASLPGFQELKNRLQEFATPS